VAIGQVLGEPITGFEQWYQDKRGSNYELDREGCLNPRSVGDLGNHMWREYETYKREMDVRVANYDKLEKLADNEVISPKPDLPNISDGTTSGLIRRIARNLVQNTPNVEVISKHDDDSSKGIFARYILTTKIIGSDEYSNDMQQNLFASTKTALTLGFAPVVPVLLQDAANGWYMKYDALHYRDVFPEPGCKDVRTATDVFVRRYLTKGEVMTLIRDNAPGWDPYALRALLKSSPQAKERQSVDQQTAKRGQIPLGYEIITWYSNSGDPFLTFHAQTKMLLRIEKNKHPLKQHPVFFLVLEKDDQQPLGKSQVEQVVGRQEFADLMLNGAMKLWYRNINPSIIGYGTVNSIPNLSPGKYTQISNPNAKVEAFEVNTQTLMQFGQISEQNVASMIGTIGSADQQMAQSGGSPNGQGMSATPQGVEAQQQMVDVTANNYQKAIESFFSHYCSYALTIYFQELRVVKEVEPTAEARKKLLGAGMKPEELDQDGKLKIDFSDMAIEYFVRAVPGSLIEMEDEKQIRVLNQLFIPLSQAMPALANAQDMEVMKRASAAMSYIIEKQIELSGAASADKLGKIWRGEGDEVASDDMKERDLEGLYSELRSNYEEEQTVHADAIVTMQRQIQGLIEAQGLLLEKLGVTNEQPADSSVVPGEVVAEVPQPAPNVEPASA
jgi:hypothetical protein